MLFPVSEVCGGLNTSRRFLAMRNTSARILASKQDDGVHSEVVTLQDLPKDCLGETFSRVHPRDLLQLSRTSRTLRSFLLTRKSRFVWRAALASVQGLPVCPKGFDEPLYAALLFLTVCTGCFKKLDNTSFVDWDLGVRFCRRCDRFKVTPYAENAPPILVPGEKLHNIIRCRVPTLGCAYLTTDFAGTKAIFDGLNGIAKDRFLAERKEIIVAARQHARDCRTWEVAVAKEKEFANAAVQAARETAIRARLLSLGWAEELTSMGPDSALAKHPLVKKPQVLTDANFPPHHQPIAKFRDQKNSRHAADLKKEMKQRFRQARQHHKTWRA
ncbi:hypothetical protein B0H11DRAFT_2187905 [Mycena galericulata]|nr:hypothetical protein B0H11DRAFT_2187905 [Mycena galericulata]